MRGAVDLPVLLRVPLPLHSLHRHLLPSTWQLSITQHMQSLKLQCPSRVVPAHPQARRLLLEGQLRHRATPASTLSILSQGTPCHRSKASQTRRPRCTTRRKQAVPLSTPPTLLMSLLPLSLHLPHRKPPRPLLSKEVPPLSLSSDHLLSHLLPHLTRLHTRQLSTPPILLATSHLSQLATSHRPPLATAIKHLALLASSQRHLVNRQTLTSQTSNRHKVTRSTGQVATHTLVCPMVIQLGILQHRAGTWGTPKGIRAAIRHTHITEAHSQWPVTERYPHQEPHRHPLMQGMSSRDIPQEVTHRASEPAEYGRGCGWRRDSAFIWASIHL